MPFIARNKNIYHYIFIIALKNEKKLKMLLLPTDKKLKQSFISNNNNNSKRKTAIQMIGMHKLQN